MTFPSEVIPYLDMGNPILEILNLGYTKLENLEMEYPWYIMSLLCISDKIGSLGYLRISQVIPGISHVVKLDFFPTARGLPGGRLCAL